MLMRSLALVIGLVLIAACGNHASPTAPGPAGSTAAAQPGARDREDTEDRRQSDDGDPCQLLEVGEVEAVLGPLAGPPYDSEENNDKPMARGSSCRYVGRDLRSIQLSVSRHNGTTLLQAMDVPGQVAHETHMKGQLPKGILPDDTTFAGDWDDIRVMGCCRLNAFLGEALLVLDYTGSRATPLQAVTLINKALGRLDKPLTSIDGRAGIAVAKQRLAQGQNHPKVCELVTRAEAEAILGTKLESDPVAGNDECTYRYNSDGSSGSTVSVKVDWSYGFVNYREHSTMRAAVGGESADKAAAMIGNLGKAMQQGSGDPFSKFANAIKQEAAKADAKSKAPDSQAPPKGTTPSPAGPVGPWDEAVFAYPEFLAVKKDILVHVEAGFTQDIGQQFATKAMSKL